MFQARVPTVGDADLFDAEPAPEVGGQLLHGAERAQPAAERAAPPDKQGRQREAPQQQARRIVEQEAQRPVAARGPHEADHADDGELRLRPIADEQKREDEKRPARPGERARRGGEPVLREQRSRQGDQRQRDDPGVERPVAPDAERALGLLGRRQQQQVGGRRIEEPEVMRDFLGQDLPLLARRAQRERGQRGGVPARLRLDDEHREIARRG